MSLGIDDPVTRGAYSSESKYVMDLARQITEILEIPVQVSSVPVRCLNFLVLVYQALMKRSYNISVRFQEQGGMMSMADAYCRVNRARGLELLSPEDLLSACRRLEKLPGCNLRFRQFDSGVQVLQLSSHSDESVIEDTVAQVSVIRERFIR